MDYRALAELVLMGLLGLSVLIVAVGFSVRVFLAPTLREIFDRLARTRQDDGPVGVRLERLDERLGHIEAWLERLEATQSFDRQLGVPKD